jgi:hypothetical protein
MHPMQGFSFGQMGEDVQPAGTGSPRRGGLVSFLRDGILFFREEGHHMRIDLRHDEVVHIKELRQSSHREVIVHGPVDPALGRRIPWDRFSSLRVLRQQ